jgi:hypothetical protein
LKQLCEQKRLGGMPNFRHVGHAIAAGLPQLGVAQMCAAAVETSPTEVETLSSLLDTDEASANSAMFVSKVMRRVVFLHRWLFGEV